MSDAGARFQAPLGMRDVGPPESADFQGLVATFATWAERYGFGLLISPLLEDVGVFHRGIGENSDVTRKEMYVLEDRSGRKLALRPEGTASVVRAFVQHHPTPPWKVWYVTPAFRYERPQAGRYRQHHQVGVEALGTSDAMLDVEVVALASRFYSALGLSDVQLLINSMGDGVCRPNYVALLATYLREHAAKLCDEHTETYERSPLRVLDCKNEACVDVTEKGPMLVDHLCDDCRQHFSLVCEGLSSVGISWTLAPRLVRGFDYYTRTTFEFVSLATQASQNAIGGGGRYDALVEQLGGDPTGGIGFGSGVERILLALEAEKVSTPWRHGVDVFVVDTTQTNRGLEILESLRLSGVSADRAYDGRSMKSQMKQADRSGARIALIVGPQELLAGTVTMRDLRNEASGDRQQAVLCDDIVPTVRQLLDEVM